MHDSTLASGGSSAEFLGRVGGLADPARRREAAAALARLLGGEDLVLLASDPEIDVSLPAPGLAQVLQGAAQWREFLERAAMDEGARGTLPGPGGESVPALGIALPDGSAAVLLGPGEGAAGLEPLRPLLPLLGRLFRAEREVTSHEVRARQAVDEAARATVLTRTLRQMRERLEKALAEAQEARSEAGQRAEQAETLAVELQAQADQLQGQAVELEMLNDELAARTEESEHARAAADDANRAKSEFLANMSHELRTPINAVIGYADLLDMGVTGPVTQEQQRQLERIRASGGHLLSLVNDVLDLAKVEAGRMTVEHEIVPVAEVVREGIALIEGGAAARGLALVNECRDPRATFIGDGDRARQILVNLLSNAVKFTQPGGRITVSDEFSLEVDESADLVAEGEWRCIRVRDTGIGMTAGELQQIFQPFTQVESGHTRRAEGTGLGLTISRQFARLMGGDLTVRSEKGRGSCFTLWLPGAESGAAGPSEPAASPDDVDGTDARAAGLGEVGAHLHARIAAVSAAFADRVVAGLAAETAGMHRAEILDHAPTFLADVAGILMRMGVGGGEPMPLRDGTDVQRMIAKAHGADRARRGWSAEALERELGILQEELAAVVRTAARSAPGVDADGACRVLDGLVAATRRGSLRSFRAAAVASSLGPRPRRSPERTSESTPRPDHDVTGVGDPL